MSVETLEANGTEVDTSAAEAFSATLAAARERADGDDDSAYENPADALGEDGEVAQEGDALETSGEQKPADAGKPEPEGKSEQVLRLAIKAGLPQSLIGSARDDKQLAEFIEMFGGSEDSEEVGETKESMGQQLAKRLFSDDLDIPEDEFDATDPAHRRIRAQAQNQRLIAEALGKTLDAAQKVDNSVRHDRETQFHVALEGDFDAGIDALGYADSKRADAERQQAWSLFRTMVDREPATDRKVLAARAFHAVNPDRLKGAAVQKQLAAVNKQAGTKLGGGPAKPAPVKELEGREAALADIRKFFQRAEAQRAGK